ncbi:hypothetical protein BBK14_01845 [Parafrankia soli]|uniref:Terminase n=1 Tax=Parafrankia soli TaxID=2599596 RepID=A0A1S1RMI6_9ACTN|nr:hypothetical protein [Parafrankia soli]OHV46615.1 hypothetical protein BBK14_01845 [Parafrankia soli]
MPWRGPDEPGEFPTLGYLVGDWIEAHCVIPDGVDQGMPFVLTDEMWSYLLRYYRLHPHAEYDRRRPSAAFRYTGGQLMRPQKWGKGPFASGICLCEALGPVRFDGWDAYGEPVGAPHPTPWVQIVATSEEQTDNTWLALHEMATRGPIADMGLDLGIQDINLPSGGKVEPRTSSGKARLGARLTFALFDETGLMIESNGGVLLATTMRRNIAGMSGRWMETTNAPDPSENSVAQRTQEARAPGTLIDYRRPRRIPDLDDDEGMLAELRYVYGDSWWVDVERILSDARDESICPSPGDAYRFFLNHPTVGTSDAVDATRWDACARDDDPLKRRDRVGLGFDGSRSSDCTSLVASRLRDGRWFHLRTWDPADYPDGKVPRDEVDQAVKDAFKAYRVAFLFGDPYLWFDSFETWAARWPDRIVQVPTNTPIRMDKIVSRFLAHFRRDFTHDGDPILTRHAKAAALAKGQKRAARPEENAAVPHYYLRITKKKQGQHIDSLIAGMLAEAARGQAIEDGVLARPGPATGGPDPAHAGAERPPTGSPWRAGSSAWRSSGRLNL